jgi:hypothetical protein
MAGDLRERARNEGEELRKKSAHQKAFSNLNWIFRVNMRI